MTDKQSILVHLDDEHWALAHLGAARESKRRGVQVSAKEFVSQLIRDAVKEGKGKR